MAAFSPQEIRRGRLASALQQAGYKLTNPRLAVLAVLESGACHASPNEVFDLGRAMYPELGLSTALALKIASPFRAGMGRLGRTCGAVTGAFMVLGLKFPDTDPGNAEARDRICALVREFEKEFARRNGSSTCSELVGCDMSDPGQRDQAARKGIFLSLCPRLVHDAADIVGGMINRL